MRRRRRTTRQLTVWVLALIVCAGCGKDGPSVTDEVAFAVDNTYERGPATVHVRVDKTELTIAETVLLQFEATIEPGYEIQMPRVDKVLEENFGIVDWDNLGRRLDEKGSVVTAYEYELEPFLSGEYQIPAFTFEFHDVNEPETKHELISEPIAVAVASLLGDQRAELVIEDIEGPVDLPPPPMPWWVWIVVGTAVIPCVAGGVLWYLVRRRHATRLIRILKPAHEVAYARLRALVAENLVDAGRIKEFYERLSAILRHYIEDRFELHAPERTTEEFLAELQSTDVLSAADKEVLGEFLQHCDLVKFAKYEPTTEQVQRTFDLVKDFIERTRSDAHRVDVTDEAETADSVEAEVA